MSAYAQDSIAPNLGRSGSFTMLGSTISDTGTSVIIGSVGATTTITGFPPGTATGIVYTAPNGPSSLVGEAYTDFVAAYNFAAGETPTMDINGLLANQTFLGNTVYTSAPSTNVTSTAGITLTFDAQNNSSEVFIMQIPGALTINGPITFDLTGGALAGNIYWIVGAATTIDPTNVPLTFDGNILGQTSVAISAQVGGSGALAATINGCVFAETANTLAGQTDVSGCSGASATPEPGSAGLAALGFLLGALYVRRRRVKVASSLNLTSSLTI
jgi:MYXO-CTERM domain-containing protein